MSTMRIIQIALFIVDVKGSQNELSMAQLCQWRYPVVAATAR